MYRRQKAKQKRHLEREYRAGISRGKRINKTASVEQELLTLSCLRFVLFYLTLLFCAFCTNTPLYQRHFLCI